jgi:hypothetical protein
MMRVVALVLAFAGCAAAQPVPAPDKFFGFSIGTDKKLARWDKIVEYFEKVASLSDRVKIHTLGPTTQNHPFVMLEISGAATLKDLDRYKQLERKLYFQGGAPSEAERNDIFKNGKAVILITNNIHSTEIGASQMVIEAVYRLATEDSPAVRKILDNVVLLLIPSLNPDGQIMVTDWYNKYLGTPQEGGPMPYLYHPYAGHDNNRDMFLFSQKESQMAAQVLWHDWFPTIWLDEHQMGNTGARIFTMPATDPINPNVHPLIYRLNTIYGQAQAAALEAEGRTGIIHNATYTNFWEGAMAWSGWWHNQVGLLTEVASARIATPVKQTKADPNAPPADNVPLVGRAGLEEGGGGRGGGGRGGEDRGPDVALPAPRDILPRTEYSRPWLGGTWRLRDIVDYELTATFALLETAADQRETLLRQIYEVNAATLADGKKGELGFGDKEKSYAAIIPIRGQHDQNEVIELVDKLKMGGVEIGRARKEFKLDGETYPAGTYVIPFTQVYARYAKDMLEKQTYPEVRRAPNAPAEAPYDVSAWSLGMQFGVKTLFARTPLPDDLALDPVKSTPRFVLMAGKNGSGWSFPYDGAESAVIVNRLLSDGATLTIAKPHGSEPAQVRVAAKQAVWDHAVSGFDVTMKAATDARPGEMGIAMKKPRVGMYQSYMPSMDEGWTRWVLDHYEFSYHTLHNSDVQAGRLRDSYDAIILPDQAPLQIMNGTASKTMVEEFRGGIGDKGWEALKDFTDRGGTLISLGQSSNLLVDKLPLPVKELKRSLSREQHYAPGTIVNLQVDTAHPMGFGMPQDALGFYINSPFFQFTEGFSSQKVSVIARYPNQDVNASGWLRGEELMRGRAAVVAIETNPGKVVLFGIRPQHRAQTHATLPLLFNALYWSAEGDLTAGLQ